jgi:TolB-like protein
MTVAGRLRVAGGSTIVGILVAWALYHSGYGDTPRAAIEPAARVTSAAAPAASTLWLLSIGVSRYQQANFDLQFADVDAGAIAAAFQRQAGGALYKVVRALVLIDDEVTRESILDGLGSFLGQAGPNDVVVIFVAGHGVLDRASGSYYFLPFPATAQNLVSTGLRMSDFDEMVRIVRRRARGVVVMLDTCHAGALQLASPEVVAMDDPAARLSAGDGFFLLAATKPGEQSQEQPALAHGAFTYALLAGLDGAADTDKDGLLSVADLFSYVAREVPHLTGGAQHPYHRTEGTDLLLAAVPPGGEAALPPTARALLAQAAPQSAPTPVRNTIGVMEFANVRADPEHDWVGTALRLAFNTELSKVRALHVYAPELIDRTVKELGTDQLTTAQRLGIDRVVTGSFSIVGTTALIDARIVDATTGLQEGSDSVRGDLNDIFDLQKKLVLSLLRRLRVKLSVEEGSSIENGSNKDVDAYRLLLDTEEAFDEPTAAPEPSPHPTPLVVEPQSRRDDGANSRRTVLAVSSALAMLVEHAVLPPAAAITGLLPARVAYAEESAGETESAVRKLFQEYQQALQAKDVDHLATLYVSFSARRREALRVYFDNALDYEAEIVDVTVMPHGSETAVSYTRRDRFVDRGTHKPISLEVRLTRIVVRDGGKWKIRGKE